MQIEARLLGEQVAGLLSRQVNHAALERRDRRAERPRRAHLVQVGLGDRAGNVVFEHTLNESELAERYARASAFVCLSEHEGFCIPLLEAFAAGVPVIARPAGGVPETAGDAALLVEDRDPSVTAELIHLAAGDRELRDELARRGRERLEVYRPERAAVALRAALERLS